MDLDCEVFAETLTTRALDAARRTVLASPGAWARLLWTWVGALLVAGALVLLGHTSAEASGDDSASDQPGALTAVLATAGGIGDARPVAAPVGEVAGTLRQAPVVSTAASSLLPAEAQPATQLIEPLTGSADPQSSWRLADQPVLKTVAGSTIAPLGRTLTTVGGALPGPVASVARDVAATLPAAALPSSSAPAAPMPAQVPGVARAGAAAAQTTAQPRVERVPLGLDAADWTVSPRFASGPGGAAPSDPPAPWSPGPLPSLPGGAPGSGGLAALMAGLSGSTVPWAAVLTLLLALVVLARARMAEPLALRSAMHASRMRRPG